MAAALQYLNTSVFIHVVVLCPWHDFWRTSHKQVGRVPSGWGSAFQPWQFCHYFNFRSNGLFYGPSMYLLWWHILPTGPPLNVVRFWVPCPLFSWHWSDSIWIYTMGTAWWKWAILVWLGMLTKLKLHSALILLTAFLFATAHRPLVLPWGRKTDLQLSS